MSVATMAHCLYPQSLTFFHLFCEDGYVLLGTPVTIQSEGLSWGFISLSGLGLESQR